MAGILNIYSARNGKGIGGKWAGNGQGMGREWDVLGMTSKAGVDMKLVREWGMDLFETCLPIPIFN